jgi:hypothetical protein
VIENATAVTGVQGVHALAARAPRKRGTTASMAPAAGRSVGAIQDDATASLDVGTMVVRARSEAKAMKMPKRKRIVTSSSGAYYLLTGISGDARLHSSNDMVIADSSTSDESGVEELADASEDGGNGSEEGRELSVFPM